MAQDITKTPQIYQPNGTLDQLAYNFANQPIQPQQYGSEGGPNALNVSPPDKGLVMGNYLHNLGTQNVQMQQQQRDRQFLKSIHDVMSSNIPAQDTTDEQGNVIPGKYSHLQDLNTQHGGGYLDDTLKQLDSVMKNSSDQAVKKSQIKLNEARTNQIANPLGLNEQDNQVLGQVGSAHPQDIMNNLSPTAQSSIKGLLDYSINPNTYSIKNNLRSQMIGLAKQIDPSYDQKQFPMRSKYANEFFTGPNGQAITSAKQTLYHLNELHDAVQTMQNTGSPLLNAPINKWDQIAKGDPTVTDVNTNLTAVAEELTKAWAGSNNGEARVAEWSKSLNSASSPQQWNAVFSKATKLLNDAIKARTSQYKTVMGTEPQGLFSPEEQQIITKLSSLYGNNPVTFNKGAVGAPQAPQNLNQLAVQGGQPVQGQPQGQQQGQSAQGQYLRMGTLPDGRRIGIKQDGTPEIINAQQ